MRRYCGSKSETMSTRSKAWLDQLVVQSSVCKKPAAKTEDWRSRQTDEPEEAAAKQLVGRKRLASPLEKSVARRRQRATASAIGQAAKHLGCFIVSCLLFGALLKFPLNFASDVQRECRVADCLRRAGHPSLSTESSVID